jgi:hypothetical protein
MNRYKERESDVVVEVLDMKPAIEEAYSQFKKPEDWNGVGFHTNFTWARVITPEGTFVLNSEGVGAEDPIAEENSLEIGLYKTFPAEEKKLQIFPTTWAVLNLKDIEDLPVVEKVNLKDFIRGFGRRLECNFNLWDEKLKDKEIIDG